MMKFFLLILTFSTTAYSGVTSYVVPTGEWEIYTPQNSMRSFANSTRTGSYDQLKHLGEQADLIWRSTSNKKGLVDDMAKIFSDITPTFMVNVIEQILHDADLLSRVADASYHNVTGFLKIVLVSNGTKSWKIRLHVWKQGEKEYPHNHKWDFYSKILAGYLEQTTYNRSNIEFDGAMRCKICEPVSLMPILPNGDLPCPCRDSYQLATKTESCELFESAYLGLGERIILGTGESYFMQNQLVHTIASGKKAITFVFTSEQVNNNSEVFVPADINVTLEKYAPSVTKAELVQELQYIKNVLRGLPVSAQYLPEMVDLKHRYYDKHAAIFNESNWRSRYLHEFISNSTVAQLSDFEKKNYEVFVSTQGDILVDGKQPKPDTEMLFVVFDGIMYASPKDFAHNAERLICHTSFTDYAPVEAAGILHFNHASKLQKIEAYSGHYVPAIANMEVAINYLKERGCNTADILISGYTDRI